MDEAMKARIEELEKENKEYQALFADTEKKRLDALEQAKLDKITSDIMAKLHSPESKMIFGKAKGDEKGTVISFNQFLKGIKMSNPEIIKTVLNETSDAQGGYAVPVEYSNSILGALNNIATLPGKVTTVTQGAPTVNMPKWLTDLAIYWVAEDGTKTLTKPTLTKLQLILKKMACIVPFTDELLDDNIVSLDKGVETLVGENMGLEIERVALAGSTVAGDPFNGVINATGTLANAQAGANLNIDDIVDTMYFNTMLKKYRATGEWWLNIDALKLIMKLKDLQGLPIWSMGNIAGGIPGTILGRPYNETDQIPTTAGATTLIYGDAKYIIVGNPKVNGGIQVAVSNSAVAPASGSVTQNAFMQDETWFRFVKRCSILDSVPEAFVICTGVK